MTDDRIKTAQVEIGKILVAKPEYVVNTSEFNDVKARLNMLHNHRKVDTNKDDGRPRLRRAPERQRSGRPERRRHHAQNGSGRAPHPQAPRRLGNQSLSAIS